MVVLSYVGGPRITGWRAECRKSYFETKSGRIATDAAGFLASLWSDSYSGKLPVQEIEVVTVD